MQGSVLQEAAQGRFFCLRETTMAQSIYFTTPIYYVNAEPHIGHLYTTALADTLKRFHRLMGDECRFLTGTDEHGEKIAQSAAQAQVSPQAFVDNISGVFRDTWQQIHIDCDDFIRTTEPRHVRYVQRILQQVHDAGDIYFDEYTGKYCVGCERYLTDSELVDGRCPDHQTVPNEVKEANYFFRMGRFQERLIAHIEAHPDWIRPARYRNEVLSFLRVPLEDLCISRPKSRLTWGIELPFDDAYVTYVWFDALLNYISALVSPPEGRDISERWWPVCHHLIAKDILKTHAVYWPTMLMAANLPLPAHIDVHGYWLSGESKMSKSLGNVVRPLTFDAHFGIENLRYFFFREMKFGTDAGFTYELFIERYNADLANGLGNLLSRTAGIAHRSFGALPPKGTATETSENIADQAAALTAGYRDAFEGRAFHQAIEDMRHLLAATDRYINEMKPWALAKDPERRDDMAQVLYTGLEVVRILAILLAPIMPRKCADILAYLGETRPLDGAVPFAELVAFGQLSSGAPIDKAPQFFPRIDAQKWAQEFAQQTADTADASDTSAQDKSALATAPEVPRVMAPPKPEITIDDFAKVDLRVGMVVSGHEVPGADKLVRLMVDIGEAQPRQVFAGIKSHYPDPAQWVGKRLILVANLKPRQMKFGLSEGMILAGSSVDKQRLVVASFDGELCGGDGVR
jgi:methionyl-tRNA synthetase